MQYDILDLNEMVLFSYRYHVPKMDTYVQFEEFVEQNIYINTTFRINQKLLTYPALIIP